jgi:signal transduction histidine kinase
MAFLAGVGWWHEWNSVPRYLLEFSCAVLFTLVFSTLAASSEKAREEVERLAGELSVANRKLREYAEQAEELATTRERNRLAREIHDGLGHYLTVVNMQIEVARALRDFDQNRTWEALGKAQELTQQGLQDIRRSVKTLRASPLDDQPLEKALREIVDGISASGLTTEMEIRGETRALSAQTRLTLYRAGQEGLTNVHRHAHATEARLELDFLQTTKVRLRITDNGAGMSGETITEGFGLVGLRERVQLLGGTVWVKTSPDTGFSLEVEVPG